MYRLDSCRPSESTSGWVHCRVHSLLLYRECIVALMPVDPPASFQHVVRSQLSLVSMPWCLCGWLLLVVHGMERNYSTKGTRRRTTENVSLYHNRLVCAATLCRPPNFACGAFPRSFRGVLCVRVTM